MQGLNNPSKSIRLPGYDYTQPGGYFITLVSHFRKCLFGDLRSGEIQWSVYGEILVEEWLRTSIIRKEIELDAFVVMPNHIHGILMFRDRLNPVVAHGSAPAQNPTDRAGEEEAHCRARLQETRTQGPKLQRPPRSLGSFVAGYKSITTKRINLLRNTPGQPVWQPNYYEHIIRTQDELTRVRQYIAANPYRWDDDVENPVKPWKN